VAVGAVGFEAKSRVDAALAAHPLGAGVPSVRLTEFDDASESVVRMLRRWQCVVRVRWADDSWYAQEFGDCRDGYQAPSEATSGTSPGSPVGVAEPDRSPLQAPAERVTTASLDQQWDMFLLDHTLPDQATAAILSGTVGFGTGHYYAGLARRGNVHLGTQLAGWLAVAVGTQLPVLAKTSADAPTAGAVLVLGGGVALAVSRIVDVATAPDSARQMARREIGLQRQRNP
jgi:hypothetical protein